MSIGVAIINSWVGLLEWLVILVCCERVFSRVFRRTVHMFQLCSYQNPSYKKYLRENKGETFAVKRLFPLGLMLVGIIWFWPVCAIGASLFLVINPKKKDKKPLVWTNRAKRLYGTAAIVFLIVGLVRAELLVLYILFIPYIIMAITAINSPLERKISQGYIDDAKRILAENPHLKVIGITGSYGKTSVKYMLNELLSVKYNVYMTPGNYNTTLGVTRAIREGLKPTHEIFLCEMGARHVGDIRELCDFVHPSAGIITSIGEQHLETFGSQENITREKLELYNSVKNKDGAYLNADSRIVSEQALDGKTVFYGTGRNAGYVASEIVVDAAGSSFKITSPDGEEGMFKTRLLGRNSVTNITGAVAVACDLGIPVRALAPVVRRLEGAPHRQQLVAGGGETWFIDDAYNSNPEGARSALETLSLCHGYTRIVITPGMVELGERESELNRQMGEYAAECCDYAVLTDKKRGKDIKEGLINGGLDESKIFSTDNFDVGLAYAKSIPGKKMILLLNDLPDHY